MRSKAIHTASLLLACSYLAFASCDAIADAPAKPSRSIAASSITKQAALSSISALKATLTARRKTIDALYDYFTVTETLTKAFQRNGVTDPAVLDLAKVWGPNIIYLTLDNLHGFYDYHLQQLHLSEQHVRQAKSNVVNQADLDYLAQGMQSWERTETQAAADMARMTDHFARQAAMLQQQREVQRQIDAAPPAAKRSLALRAEAVGEMAKHHRQQAADISAKLTTVGAKTRLFSAINAADRIAAEPCRNMRGDDSSKPALQAIPLPEFTQPPVTRPAK